MFSMQMGTRIGFHKFKLASTAGKTTPRFFNGKQRIENVRVNNRADAESIRIVICKHVDDEFDIIVILKTKNEGQNWNIREGSENRTYHV